MKFIYPFDPATGLPGDGSIPWTNGDLAAGVEGSIGPVECVSHSMSEICAVIDHYLGDGTPGSGQSAGDLTQLLQAIQTATSGFAAMPFQTSLDTNGGRLTVDGAGTGDRVISAGQILTWRGHKAFATDDYAVGDRTVNVPAGTHHLRWSPGAGFELKSIADGDYNPQSLGEQSSVFDSDFDDVLLGRFVDGEFTPTILRKSSRYRFEFTGTGQLLLPIGYRDRRFQMTLSVRSTVTQGNVNIPNTDTSLYGYMLIARGASSSVVNSFEYQSVTSIGLTTNNGPGEHSITNAHGINYGDLWDLQGHQSEHSPSIAESDEQLLFQARRTQTQTDYLQGVSLDYIGVDEGILDLEVFNG